jgi:hypothetical protein
MATLPPKKRGRPKKEPEKISTAKMELPAIAYFPKTESFTDKLMKKKHVPFFSQITSEEAAAYSKMGTGPKGKTWTQASKCMGCKMKVVCPYAYWEHLYAKDKADAAEVNGNPTGLNIEKWRAITKERARCYYELFDKLPDKERNLDLFDAFVGNDPNKMLAELGAVYGKISRLTEKQGLAQHLQALYALAKIYKLKFGDDSSSVTINNQMAGPSKDIKDIMSEIRKERATETADGTTVTESVTLTKKASTSEEEDTEDDTSEDYATV